MGIRVQSVSFDCRDPSGLARFWSEALGWRITYEEDDEVVLEPPAGSPEDGVAPDILFLPVPEGKIVKNRVHLDLRPDDQAREVARLESLGGRRVDIGQDESATWIVMCDPEENEFCVLRAYQPDGFA